jgi:hypothetical protein
MFPKCCQGQLDPDLLKRMGLPAEQMKKNSIFCQLLLLTCNPACSGIDNNPRKPCYSKVEAFSYFYVYSKAKLIRTDATIQTYSPKLPRRQKHACRNATKHEATPRFSKERETCWPSCQQAAGTGRDHGAEPLQGFYKLQQ